MIRTSRGVDRGCSLPPAKVLRCYQGSCAPNLANMWPCFLTVWRRKLYQGIASQAEQLQGAVEFSVITGAGGHSGSSWCGMGKASSAVGKKGEDLNLVWNILLMLDLFGFSASIL